MDISNVITWSYNDFSSPTPWYPNWKPRVRETHATEWLAGVWCQILQRPLSNPGWLNYEVASPQPPPFQSLTAPALTYFIISSWLTWKRSSFLNEASQLCFSTSDPNCCTTWGFCLFVCLPLLFTHWTLFFFFCISQWFTLHIRNTWELGHSLNSWNSFFVVVFF